MTTRAHILFVDDQQSVLDSIRRTLRGRSKEWTLHFATSGAEAISTAEAEPITVVVSDYMMPGMNGIELLGAMQRSERLARIPVIILTGNAETDLKRNALERGALDLVNKPITREDLVARITSALRLREAQDELRRHNAELEHRVRARTASLERSRFEIVFRLARAGEYRDEETGNHVQRVASISRILALAVGLGERRARQIFLASALHDIGKIGIPDAILLKQGKLTDDERGVMQDHARIGWDILTHQAVIDSVETGADGARAALRDLEDDNPLLACAAEIALAHHERWDGRGYPNGLGGEDIPLPARIVAIADVYDALRHARPYKAAYGKAEAVGIIRESSGGHFDPSLVACFEARLSEIEAVIAEHSDTRFESLPFAA